VVGKEGRVAKDMRYFDSDCKFLNFAWGALHAHFEDRGELDRLYQGLPSDDDRNEFLRVAAHYFILVKKSEVVTKVEDESTTIDYVDSSFKCVAIVALMESLFCDSDFVRFQEYLNSRASDALFPIADRARMREIYEEYAQTSGAMQAYRRFVRLVDPTTLQDVATRCVKKKDRSAVDAGDASRLIVRRIYDLRSKYVHMGSLVVSLTQISVTFPAGKDYYISDLQIRDLMLIFEEGLVAHVRRGFR